MAKTVLAGVPTGAEALVLTELLAGKRGFTPKTLLHISTSDRSLDMLADALAFFAPGIEVLRFPAWDAMPYDRVSPLPTLMAQRVQTLAALTKPGSRIVLTTASAIVQKLPPREVMQNVVLSLTKGQSIARDELVTYLQNQGYRRNGKAMEPGEFALRGSIIDIVPAGASVGIRIDLFGDDIESMRSYDPLTQLTTPSPHRGEAGRGALLGKPSQESPHPNPPPMGEGIPATFPEAVALFEKHREPLKHTQLMHDVRLVRFAPGAIELRLTAHFPRDFTAQIAACLTGWTGQKWVVTLSSEEGEPSLHEQQEMRKEKKLEQASAHPLVSSMLEQFPGAKIVNVKENA